MEGLSGNALIIREINISLVRKTLKAKTMATKQQVARETGLSLVTVGTVLQYLLNKNEVFESELSPSNGGRPAKQYRYNDNFAHALILFPYETAEGIIIRITIVNLSGHCVSTADIEAEVIDLKTFEGVIEPLLNAFPTIQVIGFGHPGVEENGKIIISDYERLIGASFTEHFSPLYQVPVVVENDVNAAVVGFASQRELSEDSIVAYLYFPAHHPPGAGIIINGEIFKGKSNFAGEIKLLPLDIIWNDLLYSSYDEFCEAITKLIISFCGILNPDRIVLNGNCLSESHLATITQNCIAKLPQKIVPVIQLSDSFISDYQTGLIVQTLAQFDTDIRITGKRHVEV